MKKLFLPIIIVLLIALGFFYITKNPNLPISEKILTTLGIDMSTSETEKIDLTHCISYFDGCNTCMVEDGIIAGCTIMFCETYEEPKCLEYEWTGMDLTDCISYFDGCNNCIVEDGRPTGCTRMFCETYEEPKCLQTKPTIDLTNCTYYFDGCNNCSVKDGKIDACTEIYCETPAEPKCTEYITKE